jgi:hypothetical protein
LTPAETIVKLDSGNHAYEKRKGLTINTRRWLIQGGLVALGVFFSLSLGWLAIRGIDWTRVLDAFQQFPPLLLALILAVILAANYIRAIRWRILWTNEKVSTMRLFLIENAALGLNNISPVRALDEPLEFGILTLRDKLPGGSVIATMMMCRIQDLAFTLIFITIAVLAMPSLLRFTPVIFFIGIFFGTWIVIFLNFGRISARFPVLRRIPGVSTFEQTINLLWRRKRVVAASFTFTALHWLLLGPVGWLIAKGVGIDLPLPNIMVVVLGAIFFSTALPGLPGALGTFEFAVVSLLEIWGVEKELSFTFALILHTFLFLPPTLFTIFVLPTEGIGSVTALREMIRQGKSAREETHIGGKEAKERQLP